MIKYDKITKKLYDFELSENIYFYDNSDTITENIVKYELRIHIRNHLEINNILEKLEISNFENIKNPLIININIISNQYNIFLVITYIEMPFIIRVKKICEKNKIIFEQIYNRLDY